MEDNGRWLEVPANQAQAELREALDQASRRDADEVALRRVWARLAEMQSLVPVVSDNDPSRRARWPWIAVASLAGAAAALAFMFLQTKTDVRITKIATPQPTAATASAKREAATEQRSVLLAPATVRTAFGETLHLALRGGTEVTVTSDSTLVLDEDDRPSVSAGEVRFHVPPQPAGRTFAVTAGSYRVVVVGTRFRVRMHESSAAIGVDEGTVEIWSDRQRVTRLSAGQSWVSPTPPSALPSPLTSPLMEPWSNLGGRAVAPSTVGGPHAIGLSKSSHGTMPSASTRRLTRARAKLEARVETRLETRTESKRVLLALSSPSSFSSSGSAAPSAGEPAPAGPSVAPSGSDVAPPAPAVAPLAPVEVTPLAVQARAARAAGDVRKAMGLYRALAQKGGPAGENAEYEMGRVLRDDLHQPSEAVAMWRSYRAEHPRGLLRIESDISVIETLVSTGDKGGALAEASEFIRRYPDSERRMEMAGLTGDLLRERGDCSGAIGAYDLAMRSIHARRDLVDGVSFHRSACLYRADRTSGVPALRTYLQSFPTGHFRVEAQRLLADVPSPAPTAARP